MNNESKHDESKHAEMKNIEASTDSISTGHARIEGKRDSLLNPESMQDYLGQHNWPVGLQTTLVNSLRAVPVRFFIIDNSGSMIIKDGNKVGMLNEKKAFSKCSRWDELVQSIQFHSGLANASGAATEFRLLNNAEPFTVGDSDDGGLSYRSFLSFLKRSRPNESTPLCRHIEEVTKKIQALEPLLLQRNQNVAVIICTDGESSDGDIVKAIRPLESLPCNIVVRLCTDEKRVIDYWTTVRNRLRADTINILDDLRGSAITVGRTNPWLTYGEPVHRFREFGTNLPEFNALDEHQLTPRQLRMLCAHILGGELADYPNPIDGMPEFQSEIVKRQRGIGSTWDPVKETPARWVDVKGVSEAYRGKDAGCALM